MKKSNKIISFYNNHKKLSIIVLALIIVIVAVAIVGGAYFTANYFINNAVINSNIDNMMELSIHDKTTVHNSIDYRVNYLNRITNTIKNSSLVDANDVVPILQQEASIGGATELQYGLMSSNASFYSGSGIQSGKNSVYNQLKNFDSTFIKRYNKNTNILNNLGNCVVIGTKIDLKIGDVQFDYIIGAYSLDIVQDEFELQTYGGAGYTTIVDSEGNYVVNSDNSTVFIQSNNFFRDISSTNFRDKSSADDIKNRMQNEDSFALRGTFVLSRGRESENIMVISKLDNLDWYIVTIAPVAIFEEQGSGNSLTISSIVSAVIFLIYAFVIILFINYRKRVRLDAEVSTLAQEQKSHDIVEAIAQNYESVYVVNFHDDTCIPVRQSEYLANKYAGLSYYKPMVQFVNEDVYLEDRAKLYEMIEPSFIKEELKKNHRCSVGYRSISQNEITYYEMHFDSTQNEDEVILSFENRNETYAKEKALREFTEIATTLSKEYDTIFYVNLESERFKLFTDNPEFEALTQGVQPNFFGLIQNLIDNYVYEKDIESVKKIANKEVLVAGLKANETFSLEFRQIMNGENVYHRIKVTMSQDASHLIVALENIEEEIKERKTAKEALENALSMAETASKAKSTFLNSMSHDIRTPMNAIIGFKNLAEKNIEDSTKVADYLNKIGSASDHLLSLINDVLDMSRIESGKVTLSEEKESIPSIVNGIKDIIMGDINAKEQKLHIAAINIKDENIICDKLRLNQVLLNLISNSIKYTPNGGSIRFSVEEINNTIPGYATYQFIVKDNGIGMAEEFRKTIFEPFSREKTSTVSGIQGTGLGMTITKSIVDMMSGTIDVKSEQGKGTEFILTLMLKLSGERVEYNEIPKFKGKKVLIVNGDKNSCENVANSFKMLGLKTKCCTLARDAVELVNSGSCFDIYVVDYTIEGTPGFDVIKKIKKFDNNEEAIVMLATYYVSSHEDEAKKSGATYVINKPIFISELYKVLNMLSGEEQTKEEIVEEDDFSFEGARILLVEDNELNREIAEAILEEKGIIVDTAEDGQIAVDKVKNNPADAYDVILMDIQMPVMDGYQATKAIRNLGDKEKANLPIIATTANAFDEDRKHAIECGMNDHIAKPIDVDALQLALKKIIKKKR